MPVTITLKIKRNEIRVLVWPDHRSFIKAVRKYERRVTLDTWGFFHGPAVDVGPRCAVLTKVVGEIHLVQGHFGAGLFAHELQHFLTFWTDIKSLEIHGKDFETIAYLAGELTADFWSKFYKLGLQNG